MTTRISYAQRVRIFGIAGNRRNTVEIHTPWGMTAIVHRLIVGPFTAACDEAFRTVAWRPLRIDSFAYRPIRNAVSLSLHSWALADDFFATPPGVLPPGGVWEPRNAVTPEFAACFERRGFYWGARFKRRRDVPHIEWPGGLPTAGQVQSPVSVPVASEEDDDMKAKPISINGVDHVALPDNVDDFHAGQWRWRPCPDPTRMRQLVEDELVLPGPPKSRDKAYVEGTLGFGRPVS